MHQISRIPAIVITGASGLVGKYLLNELKDDFRIFAIARRSQFECEAPKHPNIAWLRADIANRESITRVFREIKTAGGADYLFHLAAYYDFINVYHPEYQRTNVDGTKNILNLAKDLNLKLFVFASSVAACSFPEENSSITESTPPDGSHIYAWSKRIGESLVKEFAQNTKSIIIRFGAIYSDWCEYPPLFMQINTWIGNTLRARILGGKGNSAIPYIHIRDIITFYKQLLENYNRLNSGDVIIASTNGYTTHKQLFQLTTRYYFGNERRPIHMPKLLCAVGIYFLNFISYLRRAEIFEKPWMIGYIDKKLNVNLIRTHNLIDWSPNKRLHIEKRLPFLIEKMKSENIAWQMRNIMILRKTAARIEFNIYSALIEEEELIINKLIESIYQANDTNLHALVVKMPASEMKWFVKLVYRLLITSLNSRNKLLIQNYFEISGISRFRSGFDLTDISFLLRSLNEHTIKQLSQRSDLKQFRSELYDYITLPIEFGIDEAEQQYESYKKEPMIKTKKEEVEIKTEIKSAREALEETIWQCLVQRK